MVDYSIGDVTTLKAARREKQKGAPVGYQALGGQFQTERFSLLVFSHVCVLLMVIYFHLQAALNFGNQGLTWMPVQRYAAEPH